MLINFNHHYIGTTAGDGSNLFQYVPVTVVSTALLLMVAITFSITILLLYKVYYTKKKRG